MNPFIPQKQPHFNPQMQSPAPVAGLDIPRLSNAIKTNETGGVKTNPYSFSQPANDGLGSMANGAYQVTDAELKTYSPRYLGRMVTPQEFRSNSNLQDTYMKTKIGSLAARGLTPEQILAVHRGGASDLTQPALQRLTTQYQPYIAKAMLSYNPIGMSFVPKKQ